MKSSRLSIWILAAVLWSPGTALAQTRIVTGRVTDSLTSDIVSSGQVSVEGTTIGSTIKDDGTFTLAVPTRDVVLVVRSIGFKRSTVPVPAAQNSVTIALARDYFQLEAIVVTGAATGVERKNLANAVATVNAAQLVAVPTATIEQAINGKLAGADIQTRSGAPGGGVTVRLRGVTSLTGAYTPLYVIDGVILSDVAVPPGLNPITLSSTGTAIGTSSENPVNRVADIVPENIENVEVLKGASASAIYGSRASNGVILITTKRGRVGAPQFNVTQRFGYFQLIHRTTSRQFTSLAEATAVFPNAPNYYVDGAFYDHDLELSGNSPLSYETSGNVSGGTENTRYFASSTVKHDGGIVIGTYYDKHSVRLNLDQTAGPRLTFSLNNELTHTQSGRGLFGNDNDGTSFYYVLPYTPSFVDLRPTCPDGTKQNQCAGGVYPDNPFYNSNPLATAALLKNDETVWRALPSARVELKVLNSAQHDLRLIGSGGFDFFNQRNVVFSPPELQFEKNDGLLGTSVLSYTQSLNANMSTNLVHVLKPSGGLLTATTSLGAQFESHDQDLSRTLARNLIGGLQVIGSGTSIGVEETRERTKDLGVFAQEEVLIKDRLLLTLGSRWDRSSNNGDVGRYFFFPKAAASYRFKLIRGLVDEIKLRAASGVSGNQALYGQKFTGLNAVNLSGDPAFFLASRAGKADIIPERQREIEAGFDATLLGGRATLEVTGYQKRITDLLLSRSLAQSTGFSSTILNGGIMRTTGLELGAGLVPIQSRSVSWSSHGNFFLSRCTIDSLPVPPFGNIQQGKSCTQIMGRDTTPAGVSSVQVIGDAAPKFKVGLSNDVSVKIFKLSMLWDWQVGGLVSDGNRSEYDAGLNSPDCGVIEANGINACTNRRTATTKTAWVYTQSASYAKLRQLSLSVDMPQKLAHRLWSGTRFVRLSMSGNNLATITHYRGGDPEQGSLSAVPGTGSNSKKYPPSRSVWFSLDVGF